ncbi:hypothetical protein Ciccas_003915 [Cichlidogyrus casuarinus]|uniref:Uncharacterized protein n=1 Tax=Cichlidogyrus casuarinus TaxID=1844966 RepID=A0ABD2QCY7_9PLAT
MGQAGSRQEQFYEACSYGREWMVEEFINQGIDVNWKSHIYDSCPIHVASQGKPKIVEMLIKANCDVDSKDLSENTALHHAAMTGENESAELLLKAGACVNAYNSCHWTPLINAAYWNNPQIVRLLLAKGADITWQNKEGRNALHELCRSKSNDSKKLHLSLELLLNEARRLETIQKLCYSNGKNLHAKWNPYNDEFKPKGFDVLAAVQLAKDKQCIFDEVAFIDLKSGTPHQSWDSEASFTPLLFASYHGHFGIVKTLIARDANIHSVDNVSPFVPMHDQLLQNGWTALHWAAQRGHTDIVRHLLDNGANRLAQDRASYTYISF